MPRARNLKHDFFLDDELSEHPALARIFFEALWCLADYKGDLEWREKKIKAQTLPYDDCDIKEFAINLDKSRFIRFYSDGEKVYLNIRTFSDHQNPHKNERDKGSDIPAYSEKLRQLIDLKGLTINRDLSGLNRDENETDRADSLSLIPDSLSLIPEPKQVWHAGQRDIISDEYNRLISNTDKPKFSKWSDGRIDKLKTRCVADSERSVAWWLQIMSEIPNNAAALEGDWFTLDFLLNSENNLIKFIEGKYRKSFSFGGKQKSPPQQSFNDKDYGDVVGSL